jgi:hypothetical protein
LTKWFNLNERFRLRLDAQAFNLFNHPYFALPSLVYAGIPGNRSTQTGFGALTSTTAPPTGLLGVGLGGFGTGSKGSRRHRLMQVLLGAFLALALFQAGCGTSAPTSTTTGTPVGNYVLTVTATSGTVSRTEQIFLDVK